MASRTLPLRRAVRDLQVGALASRIIAKTALRRLLRGPKHPTWNLQFELTNEVVRAVVEHGHRQTPLDLQREIPARALSRQMLRKLAWDTGTLAGLPMERHTPRTWQVGDPVWLHIHGGAYALGSPATHRWIAARIALKSGARVILPEYRKAPEYPYPAAIDDVLRAYQALLAEGVAPSRLFVGGDSAGGGLALALMQRLRELELPMPRALVLLSPWVDLTARGGTIDTHGLYDYLSAEMLIWGAANYLAGADPNHPLASAVYADLSGFPPLLVQSGGSEILLGQHLTLVERARAAGVEVSHEIADGMVHVFHAFAGHPAARSAYRSIANFVQRHRDS